MLPQARESAFKSGGAASRIRNKDARCTSENSQVGEDVGKPNKTFSHKAGKVQKADCPGREDKGTIGCGERTFSHTAGKVQKEDCRGSKEDCPGREDKGTIGGGARKRGKHKETIA